VRLSDGYAAESPFEDGEVLQDVAPGIIRGVAMFVKDFEPLGSLVNR